MTWVRGWAGRGARQIGGSSLFLHNRVLHNSEWRQVELGGGERDINVFEQDATGDAANAVGGFDEVIAGLSAVFTPERISEDDRLRELTRTHEKASAIKIPVTFCMHDFHRFGS